MRPPRLTHKVCALLGQKAVAASQQTRDIEPMLGQCLPAVYDVGPTLTQHWCEGSFLVTTVCWLFSASQWSMWRVSCSVA